MHQSAYINRILTFFYLVKVRIFRIAKHNSISFHFKENLGRKPRNIFNKILIFLIFCPAYCICTKLLYFVYNEQRSKHFWQSSTVQCAKTLLTFLYTFNKIFLYNYQCNRVFFKPRTSVTRAIFPLFKGGFSHEFKQGSMGE